jgi:N-acetylglutamate synthase-like GNAT family acetyltransferase
MSSTALSDLKPAIESLKFVQVLLPKLVRKIPVHLIESVKGRAFSVEEFYKAMEEVVFDSEINLLYVLVDDQNRVQGYLWAEILDLGNSLLVNTFSIDKSYWGKGEAVEKVIDFLSPLAKYLKVDTVNWITTNPKFFEKKGFKRSKNVVMEFRC